MARAVEVIADAVRAQTMLSPLRLRILAFLREPGSASSIAPEIGLPRQHVNYHLRELEKAGLLEFVEELRKGNCTERLFRASASSYVIASDALGEVRVDPEALSDKYSADYLIALGSKLIGDVSRAARGSETVPTLALETSIAFEDDDALGAFTQELAQTILQLAAKYDRPMGRRFRVVIAAHPEIEPART